MSELSQVGMLLGRLPLVVDQVRYKEASWYGKFTINASTEDVKAMGGPWDTEEEACAAIEATGRYKRRNKPGLSFPHFDYIG